MAVANEPDVTVIGFVRALHRAVSGLRKIPDGSLPAFLAGALAALTAASVAVPLAAQSLPQLHVTELSQRIDRALVEPGGVFHLTIHVRITERRERLDELILGTFENCEITSNETERTAIAGGTDFVERLSVQALAPGYATISPAHIDAFDPTAGRALRFSSNAVRVSVSNGDPLKATLSSWGERARAIALRLLQAILIVAGLFLAGFVVYTLFVRRRRRPDPPPATTAAPVAARGAEEPGPRSPAARLAAVAEVYRSDRSPAVMIRVREALFVCAGESPGATLVDALKAPGARDPDLRRALIGAEAAAFGPAAEREAAGDAMLAAIAAYGAATPEGAAAWTR